VLRHSLPPEARTEAQFNCARALAGQNLQCYFRNDSLSDLIGFEYANWHGDDAARHFANELAALATHYLTPGRLAAGHALLIALDGENAWEHYPDNGWWFLQALYRELAQQPQLELTTLAELTARAPQAQPLQRLVAGSWVHGTLATWMGDPAKNAAWELLCRAKHEFDRVVVEGNLDEAAVARAERQLALCESSDWFWWFGDYNPADAVSSFDRLYRRQLTNLYTLLRLEAPPELNRALSGGGGHAEGGGTMRRGADPN
jgi:alpha-amylase/alpha-mannosidase (GH57 family)